MEWMDRCQKAKEWFKSGHDRGASHLIIFYTEQEYHPYFVFPEQDIELEVIKLLHNKLYNARMIGVLSLCDDIKCVDVIFRPSSMAVSRVEN